MRCISGSRRLGHSALGFGLIIAPESAASAELEAASVFLEEVTLFLP